MTAAAVVATLLENDEDFDVKGFVTKRPLPKSISIHGRQWWRRGAGGMYHTAHVYIDGQKVHVTDEMGGGGDQYLEAGTKWLEDEGYIPLRPERSNGGHTPGWAWIRDELKIPFQYSIQDVKRERDLF
jgi:hypothetical protein